MLDPEPNNPMSQELVDREAAYELPSDLAAKAKSMRIADAHAHVYPSKISVKATASVGDFYRVGMFVHSGDAETLIANGSRIGVRKYVICSVATKADQVDSITSFIARECVEHPEFVGLGAYHQDMTDVDAVLDRTLELGLAGIKIHPDFQRFEIDDPRMFPLYEGMQERGMVLLVHMGDARYDFSGPERLARVLERFDRLIVDAAHFGGWSVWGRAYEVLRGSGAYFDTSSSLQFLEPQRAAEMIRGYGVDRMMYGVDFPMWSHEAEFARHVALGLSDDELQKVLYDNCARLYGF